MPRSKLTDQKLLAFFQSHPALRSRMASIAAAVTNAEGNLEEVNAAEKRLAEEMRLLGCEALLSWADERVKATEREVRGLTNPLRPNKANGNDMPSSAE